MTYEESLTECAWCGSEHIETLVGNEPHQLALCHDCNCRYRQREPSYWTGENTQGENHTATSIPSIKFMASELAEAVRKERLHELCWQKLYHAYAKRLDAVEFLELVIKVRKTIFSVLAGKLEGGTGLVIPIALPFQEEPHATYEFSISTGTGDNST